MGQQERAASGLLTHTSETRTRARTPTKRLSRYSQDEHRSMPRASYDELSSEHLASIEEQKVVERKNEYVFLSVRGDVFFAHQDSTRDASAKKKTARPTMFFNGGFRGCKVRYCDRHRSGLTKCPTYDCPPCLPLHPVVQYDT